VTRIQELKIPIRAWLRSGPDSWLAALLAHAQDGKLGFYSCCCLIGSRTASHALRPAYAAGVAFVREYQNNPEFARFLDHLCRARMLEGAGEAERAFGSLGKDDAERRCRLIPMVRAELRLRDNERSAREEPAIFNARVDRSARNGKMEESAVV